jgi:ribulose bisphosphate carboxylase small subunit
MHPKIYLDVDGVFADYEGDYKRLTGGDPSEKGKIKFQRFRNFPHFYRNLPLLPDAMKLWMFVKAFNPSFLTAASNFVKTSKEDKEQWIHQHFGVQGERVIVVNYPNDKWKHATPGAVLVDDNQKNCDQWVHAGGTAIHHVSADDTIRKLRALLGHHDTVHVVETFDQLKNMPVCGNVVEALTDLNDFLTNTEPTEL